MKKPQRNFVIEYKSGRRKTEAKAPSSIWGDLDLKSVARDVETVLPDELSGDAKTVESEHAKPPEGPAPAISILDHHAPISTGVEVGEPSQYEDTATDDVGKTPDENDAREIADHAAPELQARKPRKTSKGRRAVEIRPLPKTGNNTPVEHDTEPDDLEQLEAENRFLKTMLAAKLRKENAWLRERLYL
ncbi:hypothetical protein GAO09_10960 [Rhizobiales bacterium RZME27]|jgi:hypothetical protein|uniref:Uncharacterized protein n=1 Tax=Endobacterium cereale TaxID=2663029 RepID=A0A6A8A627_9HYPH|nr:hypothetical protein [Endobacterium cereale]MEB2846720.1 hypothetical protein [Endobacterium cereale]MQY46563.1 hypothetical protein [Endobacterium cereale]